MGVSGVILVLIGSAALVVAVSLHARKRTNAFRATALQIGLVFVGEGDSQISELRTALFHRGIPWSRTFRNVMKGQYAGLQTSLFEYSYSIGKGNFSQTVVAFTQDLRLPWFDLHPEGFISKITDAIFHRDIDFQSHPGFSSRYGLCGKDEGSIRALFTPALLTFLETLRSEKKWHMEGDGATLLLYRFQQIVEPSELRAFLDETSSIAQTFLSSCGRTSEIK